MRDYHEYLIENLIDGDKLISEIMETIKSFMILRKHIGIPTESIDLEATMLFLEEKIKPLYIDDVRYSNLSEETQILVRLML